MRARAAILAMVISAGCLTMAGPTPAVHVVSSSAHIGSGGYFFVSGEIENTGSTPVGLSPVRVKMLGANATDAWTQEGSTFRRTLAPGERTAFSVAAERNATGYQIVGVDASITDAARRPGAYILRDITWAERTTFGPDRGILVRVLNNGTTADALPIGVVFRAENGSVLDFSQNLLQTDAVGYPSPGEEGWRLVPLPIGIPRYASCDVHFGDSIATRPHATTPGEVPPVPPPGSVPPASPRGPPTLADPPGAMARATPAWATGPLCSGAGV